MKAFIKRWFSGWRCVLSQREFDEYKGRELQRKFDTLPFWTPELIEWIGKTTDPVLLSVTSCLVNSHRWPDWLPGKPERYEERMSGAPLHFVVAVHKLLEDKCEALSPGPYTYIWLTQYYKIYKP